MHSLLTITLQQSCSWFCAASAALHPQPRIMLAAVKFFLGQDDLADGDDSDEEEDNSNAVAGPSRSDVYNAKHKVRRCAIA